MEMINTERRRSAVYLQVDFPGLRKGGGKKVMTLEPGVETHKEATSAKWIIEDPE